MPLGVFFSSDVVDHANVIEFLYFANNISPGSGVRFGFRSFGSRDGWKQFFSFTSIGGVYSGAI